MRSRALFALTLLIDAIAAGGALLIATRHWQQVTVSRPRPFGDELVGLAGRTVDAAPTALALVALAGVVAVLATKGLWRRGVGVIIALAGAALLVRSLSGLGALSAAQARSLLPDSRGDAGTVTHVATTTVWPVLSSVCGVLVAVAGVLVAWRGSHWAAMSARYDAPASADDTSARENASLWRALERGDDPTR